MFKPPVTISVRADLEKAADLRALGCPWDKVGAALSRDAAEVASWPLQYRDLWDACFQAANRRLAAEAEAEGRAILRQELRNPQDKERRDIAKKLIDYGRRTTAGQPTSSPSEVQHLATYLEGLTHDELRTHLEELLLDLESDRDDDHDRPAED
jgi:hypothetical protein